MPISLGQPLLFLVLHVMGTAIAIAIGPAKRPHLCAALGFTTGLAAAVVIELFLLAIGVPVVPLTGAAAALAVIVGCAIVVQRRGGLPRASWRVLGWWTLGVAVVAVAVTRVNLAIMSYDSHFIVMMGGVVANDGRFAPGVLERLGDYGVFTVIAQALVRFTRETYLWGLPTMLAASTIGAFAVLLDRGLDVLGVPARGRRWQVALITLTTFSAFMLIRHAFYIQTNLGTASYLLIFCALVWLAETTGETDALPLAFVAIVAIGLHRIEGAAVAVLFMTLTLLPSRLPRRAIVVPLAIASAVIAAWYLYLARAVSDESEFLTPNKCYLMAGLPLAFAAYVAVSPKIAPLARLNTRAPWVVAIAIVLALVAGFETHYDLMYDSASAWLDCLYEAKYWQPTYLFIAGIALAGLLAPAPPNRAVFVVGIPAYFGVILLLVLGRTPYYFGMGDSASRMAIHLVPLAFFYFGLKFVPLVRRA
jgi:hypothetical protein